MGEARVRALQAGEYAGNAVAQGVEFTIAREEDFDPTWMDRIDPNQPGRTDLPGPRPEFANLPVLRVRATAAGNYSGRQVVKGTEFTLTRDQDFQESWMERVQPDQPVAQPGQPGYSRPTDYSRPR